MAKVGGGINPMHLTDKTPFGSARGMKATSRFAKTTGVSGNPGGDGNMISANAARGRVRGSINGPGVAK